MAGTDPAERPAGSAGPLPQDPAGPEANAATIAHLRALLADHAAGRIHSDLWEGASAAETAPAAGSAGAAATANPADSASAPDRVAEAGPPAVGGPASAGVPARADGTAPVGASDRTGGTAAVAAPDRTGGPAPADPLGEPPQRRAGDVPGSPPAELHGAGTAGPETAAPETAAVEAASVEAATAQAGSSGPAEESDPRERAREIALRQLSFSARSRHQLAAAMIERDVPEVIVEEILDRFEEVGLVDDAEYAAMLVRTRHQERGLARPALAQELRRKGIAGPLAEAALDQVDADDERAAAHDLVERRLRSMGPVEPAKRRQRLYAMLARRGYSTAVAVSVVDEALAAEGLSRY